MDCSRPGSSVPGILQARILNWVAITFSRGFSQPRDWTWVSHSMGKFFTIWATREAQEFRAEALKTIYSVSNLSSGLLDVYAERLPLSEPSLPPGYLVLSFANLTGKLFCKDHL